MAPSWTPDKLRKLLMLLREHHNDLFLKSPSNVQKKLKTETLDLIAHELNVSAATLKYKYFNLNSAYNTECKKIDAAKKQGFFYRPTLPWFNDFRDIMEKVKESVVKYEQEELKKFSSQEESISEEDVELEEEEDQLQEKSDSDTIVVTIKQEYIDGPLKGNRDVDFDEAIDSVEFVQETKPTQPIQQPMSAVRKPVKRRLERKQDAEMLLMRPAERPVPTDEFQMFANHVAEQLRHMNANSARKMQSEIHIIFDEEGFPFDSPVLEDMT